MATKKKVTRTRRKKLTPEETWEALKEKLGDDSSSYQMSNNYPMDSALSHPKFGLGFVTEAFPHKIEVTFKEGPRILIQNRA